MEDSIQIVVTESHSIEQEREPTLSWDDMIEKSLENFGWMGFLQAVLVAVAMFFDAQQSFLGIYTDEYPTWHCTNHTTCNSTSDICKLPRSSWSWDSHSSKTIISHWGLECANSFITGLPQSSFFMGGLLGSSILAALADSFLGRKKTLIFSCFFMSVTSILSIVSPNVWVYSSFKFLIGFWRSSIAACVLVLTTEKVSADWRFKVGVVVYACFAMGYMSLPGFAYFNRHSSWKSLYMWTSIPAVCYSVIAYFLVTESPRWLLTKGREKEVMAILKGTSTSSESGVDLAASLPKQPPKESVSFFQLYSSIGELFKKRWALKRLVAVMALGIGTGMVYFSLPLAVGNLGSNIYLVVVLTASMEIPSCIATYFTQNYRRKPSILAFSILCGVCSVMCVVVGNKAPVAKVMLAMTSFLGSCVAFNVLLIYSLEMFPTRVRNTAHSLVRQAIMFACIFSPFLISAGRKNNIFSYGLFGVLIICSNSMLIYLPETKGIVLSDTMDQQEKEDTIYQSKPETTEAAIFDTINQLENVGDIPM